MPFLGLSLIVQLLCAVHCVRNGRNSMWLMVIIFLSKDPAMYDWASRTLTELRWKLG